MTGGREDLPYKVELWDEAKKKCRTGIGSDGYSNGSIGYAAYNAATREHPDRYITLRHKSRIITRWMAHGRGQPPPAV